LVLTRFTHLRLGCVHSRFARVHTVLPRTALSRGPHTAAHCLCTGSHATVALTAIHWFAVHASFTVHTGYLRTTTTSGCVAGSVYLTLFVWFASFVLRLVLYLFLICYFSLHLAFSFAFSGHSLPHRTYLTFSLLHALRFLFVLVYSHSVHVHRFIVCFTTPGSFHLSRLVLFDACCAGPLWFGSFYARHGARFKHRTRLRLVVILPLRFLGSHTASLCGSRVAHSPRTRSPFSAHMVCLFHSLRLRALARTHAGLPRISSFSFWFALFGSRSPLSFLFSLVALFLILVLHSHSPRTRT